jgi:thiol:disulfide interchange protein
MVTFRKALAVPMALTALALVWLLWRMGGWEFALVSLLLATFLTSAVRRLLRPDDGSLFLRVRGYAYLLLAAVMVVPAYAAFLDHKDDQPEAAASLLASANFSSSALAEARASGKPVFVYFTADWCVSCKVNERVAIEREATRAAFDKAGVVTLRGDWTLRQPEITAFLSERGAAGVPLYLWYEPGAAEPEQLPQLLGPDSLIERARRKR